ncbi:MAG: hypothetical protein SGPRY_001065 [Prymnesium sp.]
MVHWDSMFLPFKNDLSPHHLRRLAELLNVPRSALRQAAPPRTHLWLPPTLRGPARRRLPSSSSPAGLPSSQPGKRELLQQQVETQQKETNALLATLKAENLFKVISLFDKNDPEELPLWKAARIEYIDHVRSLGVPAADARCPY